MRSDTTRLLLPLPVLLIAAACSSAPSPATPVALRPTVLAVTPAPIPTGLLLPPSTGTATSLATASSTARAGTYTIKSGDTLSTIAAAQGISLAALVAANPTARPDALQIGQALTIPSVTPTTVATAAMATRSATSTAPVLPTATAQR